LEVAAYGEHFVDGVGQASMPAELGGYPITYERVSEKLHTFDIDLGEDKHIVIRTFKDLVSVKLENALWKDFGSSKGLMGEYGTGTWLSRNATVVEDPTVFGNEWQVLDTDADLFQHKRFPQYPAQCTMPSPEREGRRRRRLGETVAMETAEKACAHWGDQKDQCVFDVMAVGDLELAQAGAF